MKLTLIIETELSPVLKQIIAATFSGLYILDFSQVNFLSTEAAKADVFWVIANNETSTNALQFCRNFKRNFSLKPILTSITDSEFANEFQRNSFNLGVDLVIDLAKSKVEIIARLNAFLRSISQISHTNTEHAELKLTETERQILDALKQAHPGVISKLELKQKVWAEQLYKDDSIISVYIHQLRKKLANSEQLLDIKTKHNYGYQLIYDIKSE